MGTHILSCVVLEESASALAAVVVAVGVVVVGAEFVAAGALVSGGSCDSKPDYANKYVMC